MRIPMSVDPRSGLSVPERVGGLPDRLSGLAAFDSAAALEAITGIAGWTHLVKGNDDPGPTLDLIGSANMADAAGTPTRGAVSPSFNQPTIQYDNASTDRTEEAGATAWQLPTGGDYSLIAAVDMTAYANSGTRAICSTRDAVSPFPGFWLVTTGLSGGEYGWRYAHRELSVERFKAFSHPDLGNGPQLFGVAFEANVAMTVYHLHGTPTPLAVGAHTSPATTAPLHIGNENLIGVNSAGFRFGMLAICQGAVLTQSGFNSVRNTLGW